MGYLFAFSSRDVPPRHGYGVGASVGVYYPKDQKYLTLPIVQGTLDSVINDLNLQTVSRLSWLLLSVENDDSQHAYDC